jgi:hypothetical protein
MTTPPSSTICGDPHLGDMTLDHTMVIDDDDDEHYSTGYSEFCDDDAILAAKLEDDPYSSPSTTLGKRKSCEMTNPYVIVSLKFSIKFSRSVLKKFPFCQ